MLMLIVLHSVGERQVSPV